MNYQYRDFLIPPPAETENSTTPLVATLQAEIDRLKQRNGLLERTIDSLICSGLSITHPSLNIH